MTNQCRNKDLASFEPIFLAGRADSDTIPFWEPAVDKKNSPIKKRFLPGGEGGIRILSPIGDPRSIKKRANQGAFFCVAGRAGFEPAAEFNPGTHLAGEPNRPLWHLPKSIIKFHAAQGGGRGIRTPGDLAATTDFKSVALNLSAIPPSGSDFTISSHFTSAKFNLENIGIIRRL
jgi:hypothetical protein